MKIFKNEVSKSPGQKAFLLRPKYQQYLVGIVLLLGGSVGLPIAFAAFFPSLFSIFEVSTARPVVNINYVGLICGAGLFLFPALLIAAYTVLRYKRIIDPDELTPAFYKILSFLLKGTAFFMIPVPVVLGIISFIMINVHDYSWCPQMSLGSNWDSWWVINPQLCKSPE